MKRNIFVALSLGSLFVAGIAGCRGGNCGACGGTGYSYGYPPGSAIPAQGNYAAPQGWVPTGQAPVQPGVIVPSQVAPIQGQPGNIYGSGTR